MILAELKQGKFLDVNENVKKVKGQLLNTIWSFYCVYQLHNLIKNTSLVNFEQNAAKRPIHAPQAMSPKTWEKYLM